MHLRSHRGSTRRIGEAAYRSVRPLGRGLKRATLLSGAVLALIATPIALATGDTHNAGHAKPMADAASFEAAGGYSIRGAIHNPPGSAYYGSTGIFAKIGGWATHVSNTGSGGTALDTCHAPVGGMACLDAYNLSGGLAFTFNTSGNTGGEILLRNPLGAPFTTNAHGVATGLNANFLQGKQASEFQLANQPAANSNELGGQPPSSYVNTGQLLFADVVSGPTVQNTRGATSVTQSGTSYTITFGTVNVSKCSYVASPQGAAISGQLGVEADPASVDAVVVHAPTGFTGGFDLQVAC